jgi:transcriptional regulator with XRE-family HTH domain
VDTRRIPLLGDFVREVRVLVLGISLKEVERRSHGQITASYVSLIENGRIQSPGVKKLRALAFALHLPDEEVFAIARGQSLSQPDADAKRLVTAYQNLPPAYQGVLMDFTMLLERKHGIKSADGKVKRSDRSKAA